MSSPDHDAAMRIADKWDGTTSGPILPYADAAALARAYKDVVRENGYLQNRLAATQAGADEYERQCDALHANALTRQDAADLLESATDFTCCLDAKHPVLAKLRRIAARAATTKEAT